MTLCFNTLSLQKQKLFHTLLLLFCLLYNEVLAVFISSFSFLSLSVHLFHSVSSQNMTGVSEQEAVSLDQLKQLMSEFAKERDWEQFHSPRNLLLALVCFLFFYFSLHFASTLFPSVIFQPTHVNFFNFSTHPCQIFYLFLSLFCWGVHFVL